MQEIPNPSSRPDFIALSFSENVGDKGDWRDLVRKYNERTEFNKSGVFVRVQEPQEVRSEDFDIETDYKLVYGLVHFQLMLYETFGVIAATSAFANDHSEEGAKWAAGTAALVSLHAVATVGWKHLRDRLESWLEKRLFPPQETS